MKEIICISTTNILKLFYFSVFGGKSAANQDQISGKIQTKFIEDQDQFFGFFKGENTLFPKSTQILVELPTKTDDHKRN